MQPGRDIIRNRKGRLTTCAAVAFAAVATTFGSTPSQGTAAAVDPRQALFETKMDLIIDIDDLAAHLADVERNPEKYAGLDIGVDTRGHVLDGRAQAALDEAARRAALR